MCWGLPFSLDVPRNVSTGGFVVVPPITGATLSGRTHGSRVYKHCTPHTFSFFIPLSRTQQANFNNSLRKKIRRNGVSKTQETEFFGPEQKEICLSLGETVFWAKMGVEGNVEKFIQWFPSPFGQKIPWGVTDPSTLVVCVCLGVGWG